MEPNRFDRKNGLKLLLSDKIVHPEAMKVAINILSATKDRTMILNVLGDIRRTLTRENMAILWDHSWADWFSSLFDVASVLADAEVNNLLLSLVERLMIFDMRRFVLLELSKRFVVNSRQSGSVKAR